MVPAHLLLLYCIGFLDCHVVPAYRTTAVRARTVACFSPLVHIIISYLVVLHCFRGRRITRRQDRHHQAEHPSQGDGRMTLDKALPAPDDNPPHLVCAAHGDRSLMSRLRLSSARHFAPASGGCLSICSLLQCRYCYCVLCKRRGCSGLLTNHSC